MLKLRPNIFLVLIVTSHRLHHILCLFHTDTSFLTDYFYQLVTDLSCHPCSVATDIEISLLLLQELIDQCRIFLETILNVNFLLLFTRKSRDQRKGVAELTLVFLPSKSAMCTQETHSKIDQS